MFRLIYKDFLKWLLWLNFVWIDLLKVKSMIYFVFIWFWVILEKVGLFVLDCFLGVFWDKNFLSVGEKKYCKGEYIIKIIKYFLISILCWE